MANLFAAGQKETAALLNGAFGKILSNWAALNEVSTGESTTSSTYVDLATVGPTVTVTSAGTMALVLFQSSFQNGSTGESITTVGVTGATTIAAADAEAIAFSGGSTGIAQFCGFFLATITPGTNAYTMKYRTTGGTTGTFSNRKLMVFAP